jgi:hypothetical protein
LIGRCLPAHGTLKPVRLSHLEAVPLQLFQEIGCLIVTQIFVVGRLVIALGKKY